MKFVLFTLVNNFLFTILRTLRNRKVSGQECMGWANWSIGVFTKSLESGLCLDWANYQIFPLIFAKNFCSNIFGVLTLLINTYSGVTGLSELASFSTGVYPLWNLIKTISWSVCLSRYTLLVVLMVLKKNYAHTLFDAFRYSESIVDWRLEEYVTLIYY